MKYFLLSILVFSSLFLAVSCGDDEPETIDYDYQIEIISPNADDKRVGDVLPIEIVFDSGTGEVVHHVKVRIYNKLDNTEIYNGPDVAHIHSTDGLHEFKTNFELTNVNGVEAHSDWVLEAKVWAETAGEGEVVETLEFHVHPE
jgi:hypothetical protein